MFLRWLVPAITGTLLIRLFIESSGFFSIAGLVFATLHLFAALVVAWEQYGKNRT